MQLCIAASVEPPTTMLVAVNYRGPHLTSKSVMNVATKLTSAWTVPKIILQILSAIQEAMPPGSEQAKWAWAVH